MLLRELPSGALQALGVRGRPGFTAEAAAPGLLYRAQWLDVASAAHARDAGAVRFPPAGAPRADGECSKIPAVLGDVAWCYRPRAHDAGILALVREARSARRGGARVLPLPFRRGPVPAELEAAAETACRRRYRPASRAASEAPAPLAACAR